MYLFFIYFEAFCFLFKISNLMMQVTDENLDYCLFDSMVITT